MCSLCLFPCPTPIQDRISAAPPRCSPNTRLDKGREDVYPENNMGGATEILSRIGVEQGKRTQATHTRAVQKRGQFETATVINDIALCI